MSSRSRRVERSPRRHGVLALAAGAVGVTAVAMLAVGYLPSVGRERASAAAGHAEPTATPPDSPVQHASMTQVARPMTMQRGQHVERAAQPPAVAVPADSGTGRRVVFSQSLQRVWLIEDGEQVARTYLVSGSAYDNLFPGSYEVFSRSRYANGIDDSGTMEHFVRFTYGTGGSAIGFHDIPVEDGVEVQTADQLGTPLSHGCIRQAEADAVALWDFAPIGTTVVVTA